MLSDYPVTFDDVTIIQSNKWEETRNVVENTYETEAGVDQIDVIRYGKLTVDCEYRCHSDWLRIFTDFSERDSILVGMYDIKEYELKYRNMRIRNFKTALVEFSEKMKDTNGVWDVSFTLEEF